MGYFNDRDVAYGGRERATQPAALAEPRGIEGTNDSPCPTDHRVMFCARIGQPCDYRYLPSDGAAYREAKRLRQVGYAVAVRQTWHATERRWIE